MVVGFIETENWNGGCQGLEVGVGSWCFMGTVSMVCEDGRSLGGVGVWGWGGGRGMVVMFAQQGACA